LKSHGQGIFSVCECEKKRSKINQFRIASEIDRRPTKLPRAGQGTDNDDHEIVTNDHDVVICGTSGRIGIPPT
jgi:hypothetical protein